MITEMVYQGRDNVSDFVITEDGAPVDFTTATRMVLELEGSGVAADSATSNEFINWDAQGNVVFKLGDLVIQPSKYPATLIVFDPQHPDGQVIFHARETKVFFWFVAPDAA